MSDHGRETFCIVQIDQPFCTLEYGDGTGSPTPASGCTAALSETSPRKCFNSAATCQDLANYNPGTLTLSFGRPQLELPRYYGYVIPVLQSIDTTPGSINLAAMDRSASAMGQREVVTITMADSLHSDLLVDKYRLQRLTGAAAFGSPSEGYDPYTRGTFWGKWLARNPYHSGYAIRIYEGFFGDAIEDMRVRHYIIDRIDGPTAGQVRIIAKDRFAQIEARKAVAPVASRGELAGDITGTPATFTVTPSGIGAEYDAAGYVNIGDEVIQYTRSADTFTVVLRGALNTTQDDHEQEDLVQQVLSYETELAHDVIYDLFINYTEIDPDLIDKEEWDSLAASVDSLYTSRITTPTPVIDLVGELCEQAGLTLWHDVSTNMIKLAALGASSVSPTVTDEAWIVEGSISLKRQIAKRASQVWVYYGQINPTESLEEKRNFRSRVVVIDADAEDSTQYGVPAIREVFSRWIPQFGRQAATDSGDRLITMYRDPPLEAEFTIHASRDGELSMARYFALETADVQDATGEVESVALATVRIERGENEIVIGAQSVQFPETASAGSPDATARQIYIENNIANINLRTIHDSLFPAPTGVEIVNVFILDDVTVSSTSTSTAALKTGSWAAGVVLTLENKGRIQGKGGTGGEGDNAGNNANGFSGGDSLEATYAITVDNTNGEIWGGGGGGGGGGYGQGGFAGGGGGGGGSGTTAGSGGACPQNTPSLVPGTPGAAGTADAGGVGGSGGTNGGIGGTGGNGGAPGVAGSNGTAGTGGVSQGPGGTGGARGNYIVGNSFVTWTAMGDVRGGVA